MPLESTPPNADAVRVRALAKTWRGLLAAVGVAFTGLSGILVFSVIHTQDVGAHFASVLPVLLVALVSLAAALQAFFVAVTGRLRGPFNRLLTAVRDSFGEIEGP